MNKNKKRLGIYIILMLIGTAVATVLRTIACVKDFDFESNFFNYGSLAVPADIIIVCTVLAMATYIFSPKAELRANFSTGATYVPTGVLGVATAFLGVKIFSYIMALNNYKIPANEMLSGNGLQTIVGLLSGVLAFVSIAYHFFNAFVSESRSVIRSYFSITAIAFPALYSILIFLDNSIALNESTKTLRQTAFIFIAIFLLFEARISLGREKWRLYTVFGLISSVLAAYTSIPAIITYFVHKEILSSAGYKSLATLEEYIFLFAMFIFTVARLCLTANLNENKKNELVEALKSIALARESEVEHSLAEHESIFAAKQLSIFDLYGEYDDQNTSSDSNECSEEASEEKEPILSDAVIYESIFGVMPTEAPESEEEQAPVEDERDVEEIAENLIRIQDILQDENDNI